jgi:uncharacterized protein (TIGR03382 family)
MRRILLSAACALLLVLAGSANAAPVPPGGFTDIEVTSATAIAGMGLTLTTEAPATSGTLFGDLFFRFPVVDVTGNITSIGNSGGFRLTQGATMLSLSDFVINVAMNRVFAEVNNVGGSVFPLFNMVPCQTIGNCPIGNTTAVLTGIGLNLTPEARTALNAAFAGINLPANFQFGIIKQVTIVPEPTPGLLVFGGLLLVGLRSRRRTV